MIDIEINTKHKYPVPLVIRNARIVQTTLTNRIRSTTFAYLLDEKVRNPFRGFCIFFGFTRYFAKNDLRRVSNIIWKRIPSRNPPQNNTPGAPPIASIGISRKLMDITAKKQSTGTIEADPFVFLSLQTLLCYHFICVNISDLIFDLEALYHRSGRCCRVHL